MGLSCSMSEVVMTYVVRLAAIAGGTLIILGAAQAAPTRMQSVVPGVEIKSVACQGNRRNYDDFNHCMRVNPRASRYCSKICG